MISGIIDTIRNHYPEVQAVYLFGSYGTEYERAESDVDLAVLLPADLAKQAGSLSMSECWLALGRLTNRSIDLVNLRRVDTVFQNEIVNTGRVIFLADPLALAQFEMLTWSLYQKLNEERAEILNQAARSKRMDSV